MEFWFFGLKEARACLFAGLFFIAMFAVPRGGWLGVPRYDLLLVFALAVQAAMLYFRLETWDEMKAITLFHVVGFALEVFKTSGSIQSWAYPDFAYSKLWGVPLFTGFMYAAVGSYIIQAWRLLDLRIKSHPPYWLAALTAAAIYVNFSATTISAITAGIWRHLRWGFMRAPRCISRLMTARAKCRFCWLLC